MGGELQPTLVTIEWICPQLVQRKKRIGGDDQRPPKIGIGFGMQVEQIIAVNENRRVRTMFANLVHEKDAVLYIGRYHPHVTNTLAVYFGKRFVERQIHRDRLQP